MSISNSLSRLALSLTLMAGATAAHAATATYDGTSKNSGNCIPFGCPDSYGTHMGFIYQDIAAFSLSVGDIIAFDTMGVNDYDLSLSLSLGATTTNGGTRVDSNGFLSLGTIAPSTRGDTIMGNFDIQFVATSAFSFAGGGLIVDFENTNGRVRDGASNSGGYNLVSSRNSDFTTGRYYSGRYVGDTSRGSSSSHVGDLRIITADASPYVAGPSAVPLPAGLPLLLLGLGAIGVTRLRRKA
ncbi:hypothetical protein [Puniceibacterium sp. IMCC21224]|uniref:hypothetical protein n=1 Tax=Puniceibacterium sp. IMCC21224 TaxID=1618204 RepID=UPI00064E05CE|nr:hypothetical protein [Puniceibacterium sp. IMCC21224]KMK68417.1 hypothetical protein IMCC21224_113299 [Puniceibacterium sp. IMCC21224]